MNPALLRAFKDPLLSRDFFISYREWTKNGPLTSKIYPLLDHFYSIYIILTVTLYSHLTQNNYFWPVLSKISKIAWKIGQKWDESVKEGVHCLVWTLYDVYYLRCLYKAIDFEKCSFFSHVNEVYEHKMYFNFVL